jgi:DNA-binding CsgD family transcriptional regulator
MFVDVERLAELLSAGIQRAEIARRLGVSASTISRHAGRLGYPIARRRGSRFDWAAIQAFHDGGHSVRECRLLFGFSAGAWDSAVSRGDVVPRPVRPQRAAGHTRERVRELLDVGLSQAAVGRELGISAPTVSYHARRLGIPAVAGAARRFDWAAIQESYDSGLSARGCRELYGFSARGHNPSAAGDADRAAPGAPRNRNHVKQRLLELGLKQNACEVCGATEWRGQPLSLALHHVNGRGQDNRLENLQLLCPNCHSQTENFGGRNRRRAAGQLGTP